MKMYRWFLTNQPKLALVAFEDKTIVGFGICVVGGYGRRIFRYAFLEIVWAVIWHFRIMLNKKMFKLWTSYVRGLLPENRNITQAETSKKASLASIAVSKAMQKKGIGNLLLAGLEEACRKQGLQRIGLTVEADNSAARRLYEKSGWDLVKKDTNLNAIYYSKRL
jgi:ribosomal protein S18 acetylase RimI-like enzyme